MNRQQKTLVFLLVSLLVVAGCGPEQAITFEGEPGKADFHSDHCYNGQNTARDIASCTVREASSGVFITCYIGCGWSWNYPMYGGGGNAEVFIIIDEFKTDTSRYAQSNHILWERPYKKFETAIPSGWMTITEAAVVKIFLPDRKPAFNFHIEGTMFGKVTPFNLPNEDSGAYPSYEIPFTTQVQRVTEASDISFKITDEVWTIGLGFLDPQESNKVMLRSVKDEYDNYAIEEELDLSSTQKIFLPMNPEDGFIPVEIKYKTDENWTKFELYEETAYFIEKDESEIRLQPLDRLPDLE